MVIKPVSFWSQIKFHYLPESLAIVFLGAVLGLLMTALPEAETKRVCLNITLLQGVFFTGSPLKKTKFKIVLEYPDWASPSPPKKVKVYELGLP